MVSARTIFNDETSKPNYMVMCRHKHAWKKSYFTDC